MASCETADWGSLRYSIDTGGGHSSTRSRYGLQERRDACSYSLDLSKVGILPILGQEAAFHDAQRCDVKYDKDDQ